MKKIKIVLELDYLLNPIEDSVFDDGTLFTDIDVINNDKIVKDLNSKIGKKYSSYYEFDSHDQPCYFNKEQEIKDKDLMLVLINKLIKRLDEINDGSYEVVDNITNVFKNL